MVVMMTDYRTSQALDLILAAAVSPERWADVLHYLAQATDSVAGGITIEDATTRKGEPLVYFGFDPDHVRRTFDYYLPMNPLFGIAERMTPGFVVANGDVVSESKFRRSEFYDGWARPQGLCCPTTVVLSRRGDRYCPLTLVRPDGKGDLSPSNLRWLRRLVPHLTRAMETTVQLETRSLDYNLIERALGDSNLGLILLDEEGRILHANCFAEARLQRGNQIKQYRGKLCSDILKFDGQLQQAFKLAASSKTLSQDISIDREGHAPLVIKVIPLVSDHGFGKIEAGRAAVLVIFRDVPVDLAKRLRYLGELYGLTPAERWVLSAVVGGKNMKGIAAQLDISMATLKTHLTNIFSKTNTSRQNALVSLVLKDTERELGKIHL